LADGLAVHRDDGGLGHDYVRDVVREGLGMGFKDILVHVDSTPASDIRLRLAISIGRRFGARLSGLHVTPNPDVPPYFKPSAVARIARLYRESAREAAVLAEAHFHDATKNIDVDTSWQSVDGDIAAVLAERARLSDLLVLGQHDTENPRTIAAFTTPERVVVAAGTPILVVPTSGTFDDVGRHVLVAWDGSQASARAVRDAMPLLQAAEQVSLVAVDADRQGHMHPTANPAELAAHLVRHGVPATATEVSVGEKSVTNILLVHAAQLGADLLVMGAYGHPRLWEFWLGGTTKALLETAAIPVLISH
jgi:nucleotide-binding universal stress UspA family protein